ncbi:hypothetical protein F5X96DRAFT_631354 [Biscogniauxia mediterranea]|nr:hypothetical protein F5X96DRAFT_631354 [Biscogniauxia mediterranea]
MRAVVSALWCVAALSDHVIPLVSAVSAVSGAEHRFGRLSNKRASHNDTRIGVSTLTADPIVLGSSRASGLDVVESSRASTSASSYAASYPKTTFLVQSATLAVGSTTNQAVPSKPDQFLSLLDLGTITTLGRPPLAYTSTSARTTSTTRTPGTPSSSSISSVPYHLNSSSTASVIIPPNSTSPSWNSTVSISSSTTTSAPASPPVPTTPSATLTSNENACPSSTSGDLVIVTSYSITYTSTTTWTGDPADYTPPFPTISTPEACTPPKASPTGRLTVSVCDGTGKTCTPLHSTGDPTGGESTYSGAAAPTETQTVIFVTTDKNPAVVFSSATPPDYGGPSAYSPDSHGTASGRRPIATPNYGGGVTTPWDQPPAKTAAATTTPPSPGKGLQGTSPMTVVVQPGEVVLNHETFADSPERASSTTVVVGDGSDVFVIDPSRVIGAGATITRPPPPPPPRGGGGGGGSVVLVHTPTITTTIGGLRVVYGSSAATIDGTAFTVGPTPTPVVVGGQPITIGPGGSIVFPSQTLALASLAAAAEAPGATEVAVLGGELITALGSDRVVIEGATVTYGTASTRTLTSVVKGETVFVGPSGVVVRAKTLGGAAAAPGATAYEMVGGATVTRLGSTAVVIEGSTYRVGGGSGGGTATEKTATEAGAEIGGAEQAVTSVVVVVIVVGGETITVGGPGGGVAVSTWTLGEPFVGDDSWTTTISAANNNAAMAAVPTSTAADSPGPAAARPRPRRELALGLSCIAIGAGVLGPLLFWI